MLTRFFAHGKGGGAGPVEYLVATEVIAYDNNRNVILEDDGSPRLVTRDPKPEVLAGDPERTLHLIDTSKNEWTYTSGVISFAHDDRPSEDQQREVIQRFEELAFAGLQAHQFDCLWVRHTHLDRVELHFCTPRLELTTGNAMNIARPGHEPQFNTLSDMMNCKYGWADPRDPERARDAKKIRELPARSATREILHEQIYELIEEQLVFDRATMVTALLEMGWQLPRQAKNYLTVLDTETGERFRLKGAIFHEDWTIEEQIARALAPEDDGEHRSSARLSGYSDRELYDRYQSACRNRAGYNQQRYRRVHNRNASKAAEPERSGGDLVGEDRKGGLDHERSASELDQGRYLDADRPDAGWGPDQQHNWRAGGDDDALAAVIATNLSSRAPAGGARAWPWRSGSGSKAPARQRNRAMPAALRVRERLRQITKGDPVNADTVGERIADLRRRVDAHLREVRGLLERVRARTEALRDASARVESDLCAGLDAVCRGIGQIAGRVAAILGNIVQRPQAASAIAAKYEPTERRVDPPRPSARSGRDPDQRPRIESDTISPPPPKAPFEP